jgi:PTH2 family peptidyl-tRNA hydrolase
LRAYAIIRDDLAMSPGKMAAQAAHAFYAAIDIARARDPTRHAEYQNGTKVVLTVPDLPSLERIYRLGQDAGLPVSWIVDQHHILPPHFDGSPIATAVGIGPVTRTECDRITRHLPLVP